MTEKVNQFSPERLHIVVLLTKKDEILYGMTLQVMATEQYFLIEQEICYVI